MAVRPGPGGGACSMERCARGILAFLLLALPAACSDDTNRPSRVATSIEVVDGDDQAASAGAALAGPLVVRVRDQSGKPMPGARVTWEVTGGGGSLSVASSDTDDGGLARAEWTLGTVAGENAAQAGLGSGVPARFRAQALPGGAASVRVVPDSAGMVALGDTLRFSATVADAFDNPLPPSALAWTSSDEAVATVDASGLARATGTGTVRVRARVIESPSEVAGEAVLVVVQVPATLSVEPDSLRLVEGAAGPLSARVADANGNPIAGATVAWSSSNPAVAAVDSTGRVTGLSAGDATVAARSGDALGQAVVAVAARPVATTVELVEGDAQQGPAGAALAQALVVRVRDQRGEPMAQVEVAWLATKGGGSLSPAAAVTDAEGLARSGWTLGTAVGENEASATVAGIAPVGFTAVAVAGAPASVTVTPAAVTLTAVHDTVRFVATVVDQHGNPVPAPAVSWTSDAESVATVDAQGLARALAAGTTRIQATVAGVNGSATLQVSQVPAAVVVTPATATIDQGSTVQLAAEVLDRNGVVVAGSVTAWTSSNEAIATVDASGRVAGVGPGTTTIVARSGTVQGEASVTVQSNTLDCTQVRTFGPGETISGSLPSVNITGPVTLSGDAHACGNVEIRGAGARLRLDGHRLQVDGNLRVDFGTGSDGIGWAMLVMAQPADRLVVGGNVTWNSAASRDSISAGVLSVAGNFGTGTGSRQGFVATGTHRTVLNGTSPQSVSLTFTGRDEQTFRHLEIANTAGVSFGQVRVSGDLTYAAQSQLSVSGTLDVGGLLDVPAGSRASGNHLRLGGGTADVKGEYDFAMTEFYGRDPFIAPSLAYRNVRIEGGGVALLRGDTRLTGNLNVLYTVTGDTTAALKLGGHALRVDGNLDLYRVMLVMKDPADRLIVGGNAVLNIGTSRDSISAGELRVGGNLTTGTWRRRGFSPTGTHRTVLDGNVLQTVALTFTMADEHRFHHLVVANRQGVVFANADLPVRGNLEVIGRANVVAGRRVTVADTLHLRSTAVLNNQGTVTAAACTKETGYTIIGQDPCGCVLPELPGGIGAGGIVRGQLPPAVRDAEARMTTALTESPLRAALTEALAQLRTQLQGGDAQATCETLHRAIDRLAALPDDAATRPDRTGIRHVLDLTNAVLRTEP